MRAHVTIPIAILLALVCVASAAITTKAGGLTRVKGTLPRHGRGLRVTDPPVKQPHGMMVAVQSYCAEMWNNTYSKTWNGGWKVA
eukprot:CAMPEP_0174847164 /NCGR_PEP_ID=MMETSP1114-20130205/12746_1 /TAXON_ID=312471 /ORGANISM="Neobodo designis, Strain CCAP 1951/1" /LENGTH=84 /DNA_ID=CAMNT_0016081435 /DNA_START=35 /DNA_END=285 /DNA_ORIENTATION=+